MLPEGRGILEWDVAHKCNKNRDAKGKLKQLIEMVTLTDQKKDSRQNLTQSRVVHPMTKPCRPWGSSTALHQFLCLKHPNGRPSQHEEIRNRPNVSHISIISPHPKNPLSNPSHIHHIHSVGAWSGIVIPQYRDRTAHTFEARLKIHLFFLKGHLCRRRTHLGSPFPRIPANIPAVDGLIVIILRPQVITTVYIYNYIQYIYIYTYTIIYTSFRTCRRLM